MKHKPLTYLLLLGAIACQSKFEEKIGPAESPNEQSKSEYKMTNQDLLEKTRKAKEIVDAISYAVDQVKMGSRQLNSASSIISLILESTSTAHTKSLQSSKYVADSERVLPMGLTSDDCRLIKIHSEFSREEKETTMSISITSCKTNGSMLEVLKVVANNSSGTVSILSQTDYSKVLPDTDAGNFLSTKGCTVKKQGNNIYEVSCKAADLNLSDDERVTFNDISFSKNRDPEFKLEATLYKGGEKKDTYLVEISKNGEVFSKIVQEAK